MRAYQSFHIIISPVDLGIPSNRKRIYSWYRLTPVVSCILPYASMTDAFQDMFFSRCVLTSSIYTDALPEDKLTAYRKHWCELRGEDFHRFEFASDEGHGPNCDIVEALGPFAKAEYRVRLLKFDTQGQNKQLKASSSSSLAPPNPSHIVNVHQSPSFGKNESSFAPSLLQEPSPTYSKS